MEQERLYRIRHSLAHILAMALRKRDPGMTLATGPVTEDGFFYDVRFSKGVSVSPDDFGKIESDMRGIIARKFPFVRRVVSAQEARDLFGENPFKLEIIEELEKTGAEITVYDTGDFTDLCEGPHVSDTGEVDPESFTLKGVAGAYWHGDEKNEMLVRVSGTAFETKAGLDTHLAMLEEAKKRDHKKLGRELDLFVFSDLVGAGLPLWTPKGTILRDVLDKFVWELRRKYGYERIEIPHITKKDLYVTSGHWDKFKDELFRITTREGHEFAMKPMNCPHHTQVYARKQWSYRELPQRYANTTMCYRDEQSGELAGLSRARSFTQDDAHVFCRMSQAKAEFINIWDIVHEFYGSFGFQLRVRISKHDPAIPEKYLGDEKRWEVAEAMLEEIAKEKKAETFEGIGEAAFYGPKLDFMAKDAIGREWQVATIQLDMNMPERFDLTCINETSEKERIVMIHAAIMGSIERFLSVLIEHYAGAFPFWLSPVQVRVIPISESERESGNDVLGKLRDAGIRAEIDASDETLGKKIRNAKLEKIPYLLVIGKRESEAGTATVESRDHGKIGEKTPAEIIELFRKESA